MLKREKLEFFAAESSNLTIKSGSILRAAKTIVLQGRDVGNCSGDSIVMADKEKKKKRGNYFAAGGPNMSNCANNSSTPGISMHCFPKDETLRQKWIRFVRIHRKDFVPSKSATLCSTHFEETCFESKAWIVTSSETGECLQPKRYLKKGAVPTRDTVVPLSSPLTSRKRRLVSEILLYHFKNLYSFFHVSIAIVVISVCWFAYIYIIIVPTFGMSKKATFEENITQFKRRLRDRGLYPDNLLDKTLSEVKFSERMSALQNKQNTGNRILTEYRPSVPNLKNILMSKWHLIQNQPLLREAFQDPPLLSYRKGRSLKDVLVRAKL